MKTIHIPLILILTIFGLSLAAAQPPRAEEPGSAEPWLAPYTGPTRIDVDRSTLDGKVLAGYQGWFGTPGDGNGRGWTHWGRGRRLEPGNFTIDMWPDVSDYDPQDLVEVPGMKHPDGSPARLYSSFRRGPALTHFRWMREYGIDGVFLSRFISSTRNPTSFRHVNMVLNHVREGAHREGRVWAMMLDVSANGTDPTTAPLINDWIFLCDKAKIREDSRYLHHQGKPVVLLWGFGFRDRPWTPQQAAQAIDFFKNDPKYGGVYLIGGIDPSWRTLGGGGSRPEPEWAKVYRSFDAISPWDAGRYRDDASMERMRQRIWEPDLVETNRLGLGYMPTAFPGFAWDNLKKTAPGTSVIPRQKGAFYWKQFYHFKQLGVKTVFVGMFDEVDEGTAIYKVTNTPPLGNHFATYEGMPSDWYLKLTGAATQMMRGEIPLTPMIPEKLTFPKP